jgi:integrase-like protein
VYRFHQWQANLRILNIREIKTVPYVPRSHSVVERLIGTGRRECLDRLLFWTAADLERKLVEFQQYYNEHRTHAGQQGARRCRVRIRPAFGRVSGRIGGSRIVVGSITRRGPHDTVDP